jgi:palmitoyltransferase
LQCIINWLLTFFTNTSTTNETPATDTPGLPLFLTDDLPSGHCNRCQLQMPFRAHHCKLCGRCILKRDHHCYFTGVCIGYFNQRFFIMLTFYIVWAGIFGYTFIPAYIDSQLTTGDYWDYILPVTLYHFLFTDHINHVILFSMIQISCLWWTTLAGIGFFCWQVGYVVPRGITTHEATFAAGNVRCMAGVRNNFRDVFGPLWMLNFLFPVTVFFQQPSNGRQWQRLKLRRTRSTNVAGTEK